MRAATALLLAAVTVGTAFASGLVVVAGRGLRLKNPVLPRCEFRRAHLWQIVNATLPILQTSDDSDDMLKHWTISLCEPTTVMGCASQSKGFVVAWRDVGGALECDEAFSYPFDSWYENPDGNPETVFSGTTGRELDDLRMTVTLVCNRDAGTTLVPAANVSVEYDHGRSYFHLWLGTKVACGLG